MTDSKMAKSWESVRAEIRSNLGMSEETESRLLQMPHQALGVNQSMHLSIPVNRGYGTYDYSGTNPFPWPLKVKGEFWITSPSEGTWRVRITLNGDVVLDKSGIGKDVKVPLSVALPGWKKSSAHVEVWWSISQDTTLKVHVEAGV